MRLPSKLLALLALHRVCSLQAILADPGRVLTVVLAIAAGAATIVATGSLVDSTIASFEGSVSTATGPADIQVANGFVGVPLELLDEIAGLDAVAGAAAISSASVRVDSSAKPVYLRVFGIDLLGGDSIHAAALPDPLKGGDDLTSFVTRTDAVALDATWASLHGVDRGTTLTIQMPNGAHELFVAALFTSDLPLSLGLQGIGVMDLPALQRLTGRATLVDAIDVDVAPGGAPEEVLAQIETLLAGRGSATRIGAGDTGRLLYNLELILNIAGFIAILVSFLVTYYAVAIFVSKRRAQFDIIRAVGASRRGLTALLLSEAVFFGLAGATLGVGLGIVLAWAARSLLRSSVTTLYTELSFQAFHISTGYIAVAVGVALATTTTTMLASSQRQLRPAAASMVASPRRERAGRSRNAFFAGMGLLATSAGMTLLQGPSASVEALIAMVTSADVLLLGGLALLTPALVLAAAPHVERILRSIRQPTIRLAWRGFASDPGRSGTVLSSMMVGLAYAVITITVVDSLRSFVFSWVEHSFRADIIVAPEGHFGALPASPPLPREIADILRAEPGVEHVETLRVVTQPYRERWIVLAARPMESFGTTYPVRLLAGDLQDLVDDGGTPRAVAVSGHFAEKFGHRIGDEIELRSPEGFTRVAISAIVDDFLADLGTVFVPPDLLRERWKDESASGFHVWSSGADSIELQGRIAAALEGTCNCEVLSGEEFRSEFNSMMTAAFQTAYALEVVAAIVTIVSIMSFFALVKGERREEIATIGALGATRAQLLNSHLVEAAFIGLVGGVLGCIAGVAVSYRLVRSTMHASGGLDIPYVLEAWALPAVVSAAVIVSVAASLPSVLRSTRENAVGAHGAGRH